MGILITVKDADFSDNAIGFIPPVAEALEYWNYFGGSAERTASNLAPDKGAGAITGAPEVHRGYCTFESAVSFVQTKVSQPPDLTLLCVARAPDLDDGTAFLVGNFLANEPGRVGASLFLQNRTVHCAAGRQTPGEEEQAAFTSILPGLLSPWSFYGARVSAKYQFAEDKTRQIASQRAPQQEQSPPSELDFRVGSSWSGQRGKVDIAFAAIYSRELDDTEVETVYSRVRKYLALKEIIV